MLFKTVFIINLIFISFFITVNQAALTDYLNQVVNYFSPSQNENEDLSSGIYATKIPYEVSIADEKFISEANKLTGVALSELDSCQQRVVLKLKTDCHKMNDEQLAKMAVHLLNCQSYVEGRPIFPCHDDMSIKDCTSKMDSDTWTSYHLMSNRARAVCYSIRQIQFRGLAEQTVNKLMEAARGQLSTLGKIAESQRELQEVTENALNSFSAGQDVLVQQQKDIQRAQLHGQLTLEQNINRLYVEKQLILETHNHLMQMTKNIQNKLENSANQLQSQLGENRDNHQELLDDLIAIQNKAHIIFQKIEESSELLMKQNEDFKLQYESTLKNLAEVNKTVHTLVKLVGGTRQALEQKIAWLTTSLGGTDLAIERLYLILWHSAYMLIAMLSAVFLSAKPSTRLAIATLPPLNLAVAFLDEEHHLGPLGVTAAILSFVLVQLLISYLLSLRKPTSKSGALTWTKEKSSTSHEDDIDTATTSTELDTDKTEYKSDLKSYRDELHDSLGSLTPPLSRSGYYKPRSRSTTPLLLNSGGRGSCRAKTRLGTPCKLTSLPGRDYCHRHQMGDSVMG